MPIYLSQKTQIGILEIELNQRENSVLQLLFNDDSYALDYWKELWRDLNNYEQLEFSCKELMPTVIRKLQSCNKPEVWLSTSPKDASKLAGLPRHIWSKNQYILNHYKVISELLTKANIDHLAIKGVAEILSDSEYSMMRTSRDIDLLIKPDDWEKCKSALLKLQWKPPPPKPFDLLSVLVRPHAETLVHSDGIIELDIHSSAISGLFADSQGFSQEIWKHMCVSKHQSCLIPSDQHRLIIASANAYVRSNWQNGHLCKYILDVFLISRRMSQADLETAISEGERYLGLGSKMKELLRVIEELKSASTYEKPTADKSTSTSSNLRFPIRLTVSSSIIKKLQYLEYFYEMCGLLVSRKHFFRTINSLAYWGFTILFIKLPKELYTRLKPLGSTISNSDQDRKLNWYLSYTDSGLKPPR